MALEMARAIPLLAAVEEGSGRGGKLDSSRKLITRRPPDVELPKRSNTDT